jgi:hypothetical protein
MGVRSKPWKTISLVSTKTHICINIHDCEIKNKKKNKYMYVAFFLLVHVAL